MKKRSQFLLAALNLTLCGGSWASCDALQDVRTVTVQDISALDGVPWDMWWDRSVRDTKSPFNFRFQAPNKIEDDSATNEEQKRYDPFENAQDGQCRCLHVSLSQLDAFIEYWDGLIPEQLVIFYKKFPGIEIAECLFLRKLCPEFSQMNSHNKYFIRRLLAAARFPVITFTDCNLRFGGEERINKHCKVMIIRSCRNYSNPVRVNSVFFKQFDPEILKVIRIDGYVSFEDQHPDDLPIQVVPRNMKEMFKAGLATSLCPKNNIIKVLYNSWHSYIKNSVLVTRNGFQIHDENGALIQDNIWDTAGLEPVLLEPETQAPKAQTPTCCC